MIAYSVQLGLLYVCGISADFFVELYCLTESKLSKSRLYCFSLNDPTANPMIFQACFRLLNKSMLTKEQKKQLVKELADKFNHQKSLVFTDFKGLKVGEISELRKQLREAEAEYIVTKKTLIKLALEKAGKDIDVSQFQGSIALALGYSDPIMPVKTVSKFSKEHGSLEILGGVMNDKFLSIDEVKELALIPSKDELLAKLIGSLKSPISGLVYVLEGNIRNLINIFKQVAES